MRRQKLRTPWPTVFGGFLWPLASWNELTPFFIPLRRYANGIFPSPDELVRATSRSITADAPSGWVHRLLREGKALLLVDGIDELQEGQPREAARNWLREFVTAFPNSRYIVTSRPVAVDDRWLYGERFPATDLQPMSISDVRAFVGRWHRAVAQEVISDEERERLPEDEVALLASIEADRHLRALAINPLLCALLCALNRERRRQLPRDRMAVYRAAPEMLLGQRDREREVTVNLALTTESQVIVLQDLAFWLVRNGWSDAPLGRVEEQVGRSSRALHSVSAEPRLMVRYLLERSGLLREPEIGRIGFIHRTFQEYLAGKAEVEGDEIGLLIQHADDDQWREVVVMAAGHAHPRQREELINGLLNMSLLKKDEKLKLLALACFQTSPQLDPSIRRELERVAKELIPPRDVTAAESLAAADQLALDLLRERPPRDENEAVASIRTAALVGGGDALSLIAEWQGKFNAVDSELLRCWRLFDPEEYAKAVLAQSTASESLSLDDVAFISALKWLPRVRNLSLVFRIDEDDAPSGIILSATGFLSRLLPPLNSLEKLSLALSSQINSTKEVNAWLFSPPAPDLRGLRSLPNLHTLVLVGWSEVDLRPLSGMEKLTIRISPATTDILHAKRLSKNLNIVYD